jgi:hypothetical protein
LRADTALLCRDKINAHEEFSPPKLGLTAEKKLINENIFNIK